MPGSSVLHYLLKFAQIHVYGIGDNIQPPHALPPPSPSPSVFLSIRVFADESVLQIRWPKDWSFSFTISHSNEYSGLISFKIDWFDLLAVQGTLKSLLQHHNLKASPIRMDANHKLLMHSSQLGIHTTKDWYPEYIKKS